jgi:hypothetical protein
VEKLKLQNNKLKEEYSNLDKTYKEIISKITKTPPKEEDGQGKPKKKKEPQENEAEKRKGLRKTGDEEIGRSLIEF